MTRPNIDELMERYKNTFTQKYERTDEVIDEILWSLGAVWRGRRQERLGQVLMNLMYTAGHKQGLNSLWNWRDEDWLEILEKELEKLDEG
jgi:hypothetical protein